MLLVTDDILLDDLVSQLMGRVRSVVLSRRSCLACASVHSVRVWQGGGVAVFIGASELIPQDFILVELVRVAALLVARRNAILRCRNRLVRHWLCPRRHLIFDTSPALQVIGTRNSFINGLHL